MEWKILQLEDVCDVFAGSGAPQSPTSFSPDGDFFARVSDLATTQNRLLIATRDRINPKEAHNLHLVKAKAGTTVFPKSGAAIMTNSRALLGVDMYIVSHLAALSPKEDIEPAYIYFFVLGVDMKNYIPNVSYPSLNLGTIKRIEIPIPFKNGKPDLAEQKRIADKLDKVFAEIEKGQTKALEASNQTTAFGKSLLRKTFSKAGLQKVKLGDYFDIAWGNTSITKKSYVANGFTAYSAAGADGLLDHYEHEGNGIILSAIGARCGKCFLADGKWTAIKNTITIISKSTQSVDYRYAWYFLNDEGKWRSKGAGQPFITQARAIDMEFPVPFKNGKPDPTEQKRIADELDKAFALSEELHTLFIKQEKTFVGLRASVLSDAFKPETQTIPVAVPVPAIAPRPFDIQQAVALILKRFERGEMVVAKILYLGQSIYQVSLGIQFSAQNFGPYDSAVKKAVTAGLSPRNKFFAKKGSGGMQVLSLGANANKILKYSNSALARKMNNYLNETMPYFSASNSNAIERLATICKIIEDTKTTDEKIIKERLQEWKPNKFQDAEVSRTIAFIKKNKWDVQLVK